MELKSAIQPVEQETYFAPEPRKPHSRPPSLLAQHKTRTHPAVPANQKATKADRTRRNIRNPAPFSRQSCRSTIRQRSHHHPRIPAESQCLASCTTNAIASQNTTLASSRATTINHRKMKKITLITALAALIACNSKPQFDASGNFTADEVIVSAQQTGQLIAYEVEEGKTLSEGQKVGQINVEVLKLQKEQVEATISSLKEKTLSPADQVALIRSQYEVQKAQLEQQERELTRVRQLVAGGAATQKQLDDLTALVDQLRKQLAVTQNQLKVSLTNINTQNRNVLSQEAPLQKNAQAVQEQINQGEIINPIAGTVLVNYALKGEMQTFGKPLYKIANTDVLTLKAYITGDQLTQINLGQQVTIRTDAGKGEYRTYQGEITHISNKAEFTPKTIQTKSERANLVYAIKVKVKNDGYLKIGMYGEVVF